MSHHKIAHLVDDTTAGGVMQLLKHITSLLPASENTDQTVRTVKRNVWSYGSIPADVIVSHLSISWRSLPAILALRATHPNARLIHVEHSYTRSFTELNAPSSKRFFTLLRVAYAVFDTVVAVSEEQGKWILEAKLVNANHLSIIRNSLDLVGFKDLPPPATKPRVIGAIGRLDHQKGFDILIRAFKLCEASDLRLKIFGEGPEEESLRDIAGGDFRVEFCGFVKDVTTAISEVDAVAMPSRWEAFGLVALEAKAAHRRILVSDVDGLRDHVRMGAIAVTANNTEQWKASLSRLFDEELTLQPNSESELKALNDQFVKKWLSLLLPCSGTIDQAA